MSTRSMIAIKEGMEYRAIYCHSDGYPSHVGSVLLKNYTSMTKIQDLIALGALSALDEEIGTKHEFDKRHLKECTAYHRDRDDAGPNVEVYTSEQELIDSFKESIDREWLYVWKHSQWYVMGSRVNDSGELRLLNVSAET